MISWTEIVSDISQYDTPNFGMCKVPMTFNLPYPINLPRDEATMKMWRYVELEKETSIIHKKNQSDTIQAQIRRFRKNSAELWKFCDLNWSERSPEEMNFHAWIIKPNGEIVDYGWLDCSQEIVAVNKKIRPNRRIKLDFDSPVYQEWSVMGQIKQLKYFKTGSFSSVFSAFDFTDPYTRQYLDEFLAMKHFGLCWIKAFIHKKMYPEHTLKIGSVGIKRVDKKRNLDAWFIYGIGFGI
tara:strand:+ start:542 stop:1258 length:717 start_codon:yes stop_codon:yes gene_type:complete